MPGPDGEARRISDKPWKVRLWHAGQSAKRGWRKWGQDAWVLIITTIVVALSLATLQLWDDLSDTRTTAILDGCRDDVAQDDVLRALLNASIETRKEAERTGRPLPGVNAAEAAQLAEEIMAPLAGLNPTTEEKQERCRERVERGTPADLPGG